MNIYEHDCPEGLDLKGYIHATSLANLLCTHSPDIYIVYNIQIDNCELL